MYTPIYQKRFEKDVKLMNKRKKKFDVFKEVISKLINEEELDIKYKPHKLSGNYTGLWECHIKPDWLLIYNIDYSTKEITFIRTGTHSDLFKFNSSSIYSR